MAKNEHIKALDFLVEEGLVIRETVDGKNVTAFDFNNQIVQDVLIEQMEKQPMLWDSWVGMQPENVRASLEAKATEIAIMRNITPEKARLVVMAEQYAKEMNADRQWLTERQVADGYAAEGVAFRPMQLPSSQHKKKKKR